MRNLKKLKNGIELALQLASAAHMGQVDKAGEPYVLHPMRVMFSVKSHEEKIVALLHDVVEDSAITVEHIKKVFGAQIATAVGLLTHRKEDSYANYIDGIASNALAKAVKIADLRDNLDPRRGSAPNPKYVKAYEKLTLI